MKYWRMLVDYIKASVDELKKVTWPSREETVRYTVIVVIAVLISVGILTVVDFGLNKVVNYLTVQ